MASSGSFLSSGWYSSSKGDYIYLEFAWSVSGTSIENNQKTIYWELRGKRSASGFVNAGGFKVVIDGATVYSVSTDDRIELRNGTVVASGSKTFTHNADGTRSFSVYIEGGIYYYEVNCSGSKTFELDTIPRASTISCTTANIESNPTITINRASPNFTHTITYAFGNVLGTIVEKTSATSITSWTIPAAFYTQIPNERSGWGGLYCTTYNGATEIGTTRCDLTVTTDETKCKPTVSGTVVDTNSKTIAVTGNPSVLVRYCSNASCTINATLNKSAEKILLKTINNVSVSGNTLEIPNVETGIFDFYAKDSREYFNSYKAEKTLVPYVRLTNDATVYREDPTSGNATLKIEGNYFNGSFGAVNNTLTVEYRLEGESKYTPVTPTINGNKYSATVSLTRREYTKAYNYEVVVSDELNTVPKPLTLQKGIPVFDWGESDFNFNVPISIYGTPIVNHIVEQGKDGIWTYRKWSDGTSECWGNVVHENVAVENTWGTLCESPGYVVGLPSGLFIETPQFSITLVGNLGAMLQVFSEGSPTNTPYWCAARPYAGTIGKLNTSIVAFGRWK